MRLVFLGTPEFAVPSLEALARAGHEVALVVTQPDRPRGRAGVAEPPAVKQAALRLDVPVIQPEKAGADEAVARLRAAAADLGVVAAFGQILPARVLEATRLGHLNVHASLLPRWRGAAPIARAILDGDRTTGVTIMRVERRLDAGPILLARETAIVEDETTGALTLRLARLGAEAIVEAVARVARGEARFEPQDEARATYARTLEKEDGRIPWPAVAARIVRHVRAMSPWPGAFSTITASRAADADTGHLKRLVVLRAAEAPAEAGEGAFVPGDVVRTAPDVAIACGPNGRERVRLLEVVPSGKRAMLADAFVRGRGILPGQRLA